MAIPDAVMDTPAGQSILLVEDEPLIALAEKKTIETVDKTEKISSYGYVVKNSGDTVLLASIRMAFRLHGTLSLEDLVDRETLQSLMDDFYRLTKVGAAIVDVSGNVLVATGWQEIWTRFHRLHPEAAEHCRESDVELTQGIHAGTFKAYKCKNNLWDVATPIVVGDQHLGNIFIGQFFYDDEMPDRELFRTQAQAFGFDEAQYLAALEQVPRFSRERVNTAMKFYAELAGAAGR